MVDASCTDNISVKVVVHLLVAPDVPQPPIVFTCDITSRVDHVISHVVCELGTSPSDGPEEYVLKVFGLAEFLSPESSLGDYEYVHNCIKLETDVNLCLIRMDQVSRPLLRTAEDDEKDVELQVEDLLSREPADALTYETVCVLLDTIHGETERVITSSQAHSKSLLQSVKALCSLLGSIETTDLSTALENLMHVCSNNKPEGRGFNRAEIVAEDGPYSVVVLPGNKLRTACTELVTAIRKLIAAYTCAFRVNFSLPVAVRPKSYESSSVLDCISLRVCALHRLDPAWSFDTYEVRVELLHGTQSVAQGQVVFGRPNSRQAFLFPNRVVFDELVSFSSVAICTLPRESRLVLTVYGMMKLADSDTGHGVEPQRVELGWTAQNFFRFGDPHWSLVQGTSFFEIQSMGDLYISFGFGMFQEDVFYPSGLRPPTSGPASCRRLAGILAGT